jgi:hypothetical protein
MRERKSWGCAFQATRESRQRLRRAVRWYDRKDGKGWPSDRVRNSRTAKAEDAAGNLPTPKKDRAADRPGLTCSSGLPVENKESPQADVGDLFRGESDFGIERGVP